MDPQSTAVSFPVPFSCMSVPSHHLTTCNASRLRTISKILCSYALAQGLLWTARFVWQEMISWLFVTRRSKVFPARQKPTGNRNFSIYRVCSKQTTSNIQTTCLKFPVSLLIYSQILFELMGRKTSNFYKSMLFLKSQDTAHGGFCSPCVRPSDLEILQMLDEAGSNKAKTGVIIFWPNESCNNFGEQEQISLYYLVNL